MAQPTPPIPESLAQVSGVLQGLFSGAIAEADPQQIESLRAQIQKMKDDGISSIHVNIAEMMLNKLNQKVAIRPVETFKDLDLRETVKAYFKLYKKYLNRRGWSAEMVDVYDVNKLEAIKNYVTEHLPKDPSFINDETESKDDDSDELGLPVPISEGPDDRKDAQTVVGLNGNTPWNTPPNAMGLKITEIEVGQLKKQFSAMADRLGATNRILNTTLKTQIKQTETIKALESKLDSYDPAKAHDELIAINSALQLQITHLKEKVKLHDNQLQRQIDRICDTLDTVGLAANALETRIDQIKEKFEAQEEKIDNIHADIHSLNETTDALELKAENLESQPDNDMISQLNSDIVNLGYRVDRLNARLGDPLR
jgi:hypothetical protein